jgi:hypothetical protein
MWLHNAPKCNNKSNPELKEAILNTGYSVVILEQCPEDYSRKQLEVREQYYIDLHWDSGLLYNKSKSVRCGCRGNSRAKRPYRALGPSPNKGKRYSKIWEYADNIRADYAAGIGRTALKYKYKCGLGTINKIIYENA